MDHEMDLNDGEELLPTVHEALDAQRSKDQRSIIDDEDRDSLFTSVEEDVDPPRPPKRRKVGLRTIQDILTSRLSAIPGWYQATTKKSHKSSHIVFTIFGRDHASLVIEASPPNNNSHSQKRIRVAHNYDLGKEEGFLLFLNDQFGLGISKTDVSLQSPEQLIAKVYVVDVESLSLDEIEAFLAGLPTRADGHIMIRLSDDCGMQVGLPTEARGAPVWIEPVSQNAAWSNVGKAVKKSLNQIESVQDCRRIKGTDAMRAYVNWSGEVSGVLEGLLRNEKSVEIPLGKKRVEIKRMEFCQFCSYDCIGEAWPHTPEYCSTLQFLGDFEWFKLRVVTATTKTSTIVVPNKPNLRLRQNHDSTGRRRKDRERK
ncbi:hypothetical protein L218DRAFT_365789 [Marasmius fiardii PR-910]|nr:hypothetical protein L218DRAFT_365789 [Marasmius fiardii PR-910]